MKLLATWNAYSEFEIPDDVFLISILVNTGIQSGVVGSWTIIWNTLHYIDKHGNEQTIKGSEIEADGKRPSDAEEVKSD
jgi:hypothetical protein